ncbi:MAG: hypothetical protein GDA40_06800 [Rhodobacteraceae bacterium]|nr:hypothetical protein [Paracoccaceae bacterium]
MTDVNWTVVTTAMEPPAILLSYVAHHLDLGASEIHFFLDSPDPAFEVLAATKPQLRIYHGNAANWSSLHGTERPWDHRLRQVANANLAYNTTRCD